MIDREKVIRELQYELEKAEKDGSLYVKIHMTRPIILDIINILKEQKAVEPITDNENRYWCGSCHEDMVWHQKYCSNCGKRVKWND